MILRELETVQWQASLDPSNRKRSISGWIISAHYDVWYGGALARADTGSNPRCDPSVPSGASLCPFQSVLGHFSPWNHNLRSHTRSDVIGNWEVCIDGDFAELKQAKAKYMPGLKEVGLFKYDIREDRKWVEAPRHCMSPSYVIGSVTPRCTTLWPHRLMEVFLPLGRWDFIVSKMTGTDKLVGRNPLNQDINRLSSPVLEIRPSNLMLTKMASMHEVQDFVSFFQIFGTGDRSCHILCRLRHNLPLGKVLFSLWLSTMTGVLYQKVKINFCWCQV